MKYLSMVLRGYRTATGIKARCNVPVIRETPTQYVIDGSRAEMVLNTGNHYRFPPREDRVIKKTGKRIGMSSPMLNTWRCEAVIEDTP